MLGAEAQVGAYLAGADPIEGQALAQEPASGRNALGTPSGAALSFAGAHPMLGKAEERSEWEREAGPC